MAQALEKYFDNNATTPLCAAAREALLAACDGDWLNPSSLYAEAGRVRRLLEEARERLAEWLAVAEPDRVIFLSGATEANNIIVRHFAEAATAPVLLSGIEHPSLLRPAERLLGSRLRKAAVSKEGVVEPDALAKLLKKGQPALVSVMAANNETGVLQPWREIRRLCRELGAPFHCDATQWVGKLDPSHLGQCDWISGSAHKFGGPKGVGFLVVPEDQPRLEGSAIGGPQERGMRAGTENYPGIAAMIAALADAEAKRVNAAELARGRDAFEAAVVENIPGVKLCGAGADRLWNTSMLVMPEHSNLKWLTRLSDLGFAVSTGSACSSGQGNPSHVMQALGLDFQEMGRVLRMSGGWQTTATDWLRLAEAMKEAHGLLGNGGGARRPTRKVSLSQPGGFL